MEKNSHTTVSAQRAPISDALLADRTLYVSGQIALDAQGNLVGHHDAQSQAAQCFDNLHQILQRAGMTLQDVVMLRCYLVTSDAYQGYASVKRRLFGDNPPPGTAVIVAGLLVPGALLEIEAVAVRTSNEPGN